MEIAENKKVTGWVFEIERYAINDGPGIRTLVFMKGCSLRCLWCSNPESQMFSPQLVYYPKRCLDCGECIKVCELGALFLGPEGILINRDLCNLCGECAFQCNAQALVMLGKKMTPEEVLDEVLKDEPFYRKSNGGVTFSGGEPLEQADFLVRTAQLCKESYIHTAVETCGAVSWEVFEGVLPFIDLFLYDIKEIDPKLHKEYTGVSNELILKNFKRLIETNKDIIVRIPVVPGYNDRDENFEMIIKFLNENAPGVQVDLLPYHRLGRTKYERLGISYSLDFVEPPSSDRMEALKSKFIQRGLRVSIGG